MFSFKPFKIKDVTVVDVNNPEPWTKPVAPYSTFHWVSLPPDIQLTSAPLDVTLLTNNPLGSEQEGHALIPLTLTGTDDPDPSSNNNTLF